MTPDNTHEHEYTVPVEWRYIYDEQVGGDYTSTILAISEKRVTKLRCNKCDSEVSR